MSVYDLTTDDLVQEHWDREIPVPPENKVALVFDASNLFFLPGRLGTIGLGKGEDLLAALAVSSRSAPLERTGRAHGVRGWSSRYHSRYS